MNISFPLSVTVFDLFFLHKTLFPILCVCVKSLSRVRLFATLWTVARQAPLSMGFSRQEYWSGLPFSHHYRQLALLGKGFGFAWLFIFYLVLKKDIK